MSFAEIFRLVLISIIVITPFQVVAFAEEDTFESVLLLPPETDNPRNSEGDFVKLSDGQIFFVYTHFTGTSSSDHATANLAGRFF